MDWWKRQRVLVIAPHPDDEVFGCGGLIHRCKKAGGKVFVLFMTVGTTKDFSARGVSTERERVAEIQKVARFLRFDGYRLAFPGNNFHLRLDTVPQKDLIDAIERGPKISLERIKPTMVVTTSPDDYNQDHRAVAQAVVTATRPTAPAYKHLQRTVLFSELPYSDWTVKSERPVPNFFVELNSADLRAKVAALRWYRSQLKNSHGPLSVYGVTTLAQTCGLQCGTRWAEGYVAQRMLV